MNVRTGSQTPSCEGVSGIFSVTFSRSIADVDSSQPQLTIEHLEDGQLLKLFIGKFSKSEKSILT